MAMETRERGGLYFYRSRRIGRRVVKEYVGAGEWARAAYFLESIERRREEERRQVDRQIVAHVDGLLRLIGQHDALIDALVAQAFTEAGYHNHRGQWRKRRGNNKVEGAADCRAANGCPDEEGAGGR